MCFKYKSFLFTEMARFKMNRNSNYKEKIICLICMFSCIGIKTLKNLLIRAGCAKIPVCGSIFKLSDEL